MDCRGPEDEEVSCPVCGTKVGFVDINSHIDRCLKGCGSAEEPSSTPETFNEDKQEDKTLLPEEEEDPSQCLLASANTQNEMKSLSDVLGKRKRSPGETSGTNESPKSRKTGNFNSEKKVYGLQNWNASQSRSGVSRASEQSYKMGSGKKNENTDLNSNKGNNLRSDSLSNKVPLAEQMRPCNITGYIGQNEITEENNTFMKLINANEIPSLILWGPPGCGKTTLAHIIGCNSKKSGKARFVKLSATSGSVSEAKDVIKTAKNELSLSKRKTILFIDEIHRFNKLQQDTFLPHVENGTITLIGATTENPSFHVNNALLSRCRVLVLKKLGIEHVRTILIQSVLKLGATVINNDGIDIGMNEYQSTKTGVKVQWEAVNYLAHMCDGDARIALNGLEMAMRCVTVTEPDNDTDTTTADTKNEKGTGQVVTVDMVREAMQRSHVQYDRNGEEHFNMISAFQKSIRGSDDNGALYWLARMLEGGENPLYIARRLIRTASEDVGLADVKGLQVAVAAYQACHLMGMPECDVVLAEATVYLSRAHKSFEVYGAYEKAKNIIKNWKGPQPGVPLHLRNAPTKLMKDLGYSKGYVYGESADQTYLPNEMKDMDFFDL